MLATPQQGIAESLEQVNQVRSAASAASKKAAQTIIEKGKAKHPCTVYNVGDVVLVRTTPKDSRLRRGGKKIGSSNITDGVVTACQPEKGRYKVSMAEREKWVLVQDITSPTRHDEKIKRNGRPF